MEPFLLNAAQRKLYNVALRQREAGRGVRIIILKARQMGFSTLTEALLFFSCVIACRAWFTMRCPKRSGRC